MVVVAASGTAIAAPPVPPVLTSPTNGQIVEAGSSIHLIATDDDPSVTSVDFFDGTTPLFNVTSLNGTFSTSLWVVSAGPHMILAKANSADAGSPTSSATARLQGDNAPPSVTLAPLPSAFVRGTVAVTGTTSDDTRVAKVDLLNGGTVVGTLNNPPATWTINWLTGADGPVSLTSRATDALGKTGASAATDNVTVDNTPPGPFTVRDPVSPVISNPTIGWTASTGAASYTVIRDGVSLGSTTALSLTDPTATQGVHQYVVIASDAAANTTVATPSPTAIRVDASGATAPTVVSGKSPTNNQPSISWTAPAGVTISKWQVIRDGASASPIDVPAAVTSFVDTSALADGPHSYQVRGVDGSSPLTASTTVTIVLDSTPPAVRMPTATALDDGSITFAWPAVTDPAPGTGVTQVYLRASGSEVCSGDATLTACTDRTARVGISSTYSLFAIDRAGNIASQSVDVTARDAIPPSSPRGVSVKVKNQIATVTWKAAAPQEGVASWKVIQLAARTTKPKSPADGAPVCPLVPAKLTTCTSRTPLKAAVPVRFAVFAIDEANNASAPAVVLVKNQRSDRTAPVIVGGVRAAISPTHTFATLTWKRPPDTDLKEFVIRWLPKGFPAGVKVGFFAYRGHATTVKLGQRPGTTRYYAVYATDRSGNASPAARIKVVMPKAVKAKPRKPGSGPVITIN